MATYQYIARRFYDNWRWASLPLDNVRYGFGLNEKLGQFSASLTFPTISAGNISPQERDAQVELARLWKVATIPCDIVIDVIRDGTLMHQYEILDASYDEETRTVQMRGREAHGWYSDITVNHLDPGSKWSTTAELLTAAQQLLEDHDQPGFTVTMPKGTSGGAAAYHFWLGSDFKPVAEALSDLAKVGFDYALRCRQIPGTNDMERVIELWAGKRGVDRTTSVKLSKGTGAGNLVTFNVRLPGTKSRIIVASTAGPEGLRLMAARENASTYPHRVLVHQISDQVQQDVLDKTAEGLALTYHDPMVISATAVADGTELVLGAFDTGDTLTLGIAPNHSPFFPEGLLMERRIVGFQVEVPDEGDPEEITFEFDTPEVGP